MNEKIQENYILKANREHNYKYDYSMVKYENKYSKIKIICNDCKSVFIISAISHINGTGCNECYKNKKNIDKIIKNDHIPKKK